MDASPSHKRLKRQRFQPFVIKKGIVMRAKQRQKMALELSKSKNDSTMCNDPKLTQLKYNNRSLSKALSEQKMENKCLLDEKIQLQRDFLANHEVILALRSELQTHEDDLLQIHEVFRSSLQLLVTLTGHLNVGLQRCTAGRRRSKSVSLGAAGLPARTNRSLSMAGLAQADGALGSPRHSGAVSRKLHKVLPTVAGNVISHPSIVLPRLPAGGGWLLPPPAGSHRGSEHQESMDEDEEQEEEEEEEEEPDEDPEPLAEIGERGAVSAPMADLSVILEQSVLDADHSAGSPPGRLSSAGRLSAGRLSAAASRHSGSMLQLAQVVVPAEERLFGDEAWMRQRSPGRERVVVAAEERLFGDEAWHRQRCRGPARVLVSADERLSGDEAWRRSGSSSLESPASAAASASAAAASATSATTAAARRSQSRPSQGRLSAGSAVEVDRTAPSAAPAASPGPETPAGRHSRSPTTRTAALSNGDVSTVAAASPAAELEESVVIQRRTQRARTTGRPSTVSADETLPSHPTANENIDAASADPDESVIISRRQASPEVGESTSNSPLAAADADESIIVSRKAPCAHKSASAHKTSVPTADESTLVPRRATAGAAAAAGPPAVPSTAADEQDADQSVIISRKVRRQPRSLVASAEEPTDDADQSVVITRKVRRRYSVAGTEAQSAATRAAATAAAPAATTAAAPAVATEAAPAEATAAAPAAAPRRNKRSKAAREQRRTTTMASPDSGASAAAAICRDEATPSPELGVKQRYRHMLGKRSPRAVADSRIAPASADDPLEGPSNRVWLAAPSTAGRRSRGRPRSRSLRASPAAEDRKLTSPVVVVVDRASATAAAADSSEPELQPATAKQNRRRRAADGAAGDCDAVTTAAAGDGDGSDGADGAHSASPPVAKRGRGRGRGQGGRGGGGRGRGKRGGFRGGVRGRRSVSAEPLPPVPVPDWSLLPAAPAVSDGTGTGRDPALFVYPELPAAPPEPTERGAFATGPVSAESGLQEEDGSASAARGRGARRRVDVAELPSSTAPSAAEPETQDGAPAGTSEADSISAEAADRPVVLAEPTSTTESPPAAESSTGDPPESRSPSVPARVVTIEPSDRVPPVVAEPSESPEPTPDAAAEPSTPATSEAGESSGSPARAVPEPSVPGPSGAVPPPDSPVRRTQSARTTPQSSPDSEDWAAEQRGAGRRRRKAVSYVEQRLNKKLRR